MLPPSPAVTVLCTLYGAIPDEECVRFENALVFAAMSQLWTRIASAAGGGPRAGSVVGGVLVSAK